MVIPYSWYNEEQTIIHATFPATWTWEEVYELVQGVYDLEDSVAHGVHVIYELSDYTRFSQTAAIPNLRKLLSYEHPNDRMTIFITRSFFPKMIMDTVAKMHKGKIPFSYAFVKTLDDALAKIAAYDEAVAAEDQSSQP